VVVGWDLADLKDITVTAASSSALKVESNSRQGQSAEDTQDMGRPLHHPPLFPTSLNEHKNRVLIAMCPA